MSTQDSIAARLKSDWPFCLVLIPIAAAWICDRHVPADMRNTIVNVISILLTLTFVGIFQNQRQELAELAIRDNLTGVFNSSYLRIELEREVFLSQRTRVPLSIIFLDVDDLKSVNDRYGHMAGNTVLRALGRGLRAKTRQHMDLCFRFGGDEFLILCPHADPEIAKEVAERILALADTVAALKVKKITLSLGLIQLGMLESPDSFLKRADRAMYSVKKNGKNGIGLDPEDRRVPAMIAYEK